MKKIYVDADACPVKEEIIKVATRHRLKVLMVCNGGIRPFKNDFVDLVIVSEGPDEADKWIYENVSYDDIVITADIPLAAKCIEKNALVIDNSNMSIKDQLIKISYIIDKKLNNYLHD